MWVLEADAVDFSVQQHASEYQQAPGDIDTGACHFSKVGEVFSVIRLSDYHE